MIHALELSHYVRIIAALRDNTPMPFIGNLLYTARYEGKLYSKGRPRVTKTGHAFTPTNTRKFEKAVAKFYDDTSAPFLFCPLEIALTLHDKAAKKVDVVTQAIMDRCCTFSTIGDIDNRAKSVLDAGNNVLFKDDAQISQLYIARQYSAVEGFTISVRRSGYSRNEIDNIRNVSGGKL